jgi:GntR family transcriptional regulator
MPVSRGSPTIGPAGMSSLFLLASLRTSGSPQGWPSYAADASPLPTGEPPFQLVDTWIHPDAVADAPQVAEPNTGPGGYLDRLEQAGHGPITWTEIARVRMPSREEAALLGISTAVPVLELTRVGTSARTGAAIEATVCVIPGDRVELVTVLQREPSAKWPIRPATPGVYDSGQPPPARAAEGGGDN